MQVNVTKISFPEIDLATRDSHKLRGYFGEFFKEESPLLHNHFESGETRYSYPLVQYKVIRSVPYLIGINEGSILLNNLFMKLKNLKIGGIEIPINEKKIELSKEPIGIDQRLKKYRFISLWLALNQTNYRNYVSCFEENEKKAMLNKILVGNILSMFKYLGLRIETQIYIELWVKEKHTLFKNNDMLGFEGHFKTNALLPSYFGLGKSVSRGFGTIGRIENASIY